MSSIFLKKHLKGFYKYIRNVNTKDNVAVYGTFFVTFSSLLGNFFAYLFQLIIARVLTISEFGDLTAFLSLLAFISAPLAIISTALIKVVSKIKNQDYPKKLSEFFYTIFVFDIVLVLFFSLLLWVFKPFILSYLNIVSTRSYPFFILYVSMLIAGFIFLPFFQSLHRFKAHSLLNTLSHFNRFLVSVISFVFSLKLFNVFKLLVFQAFFSILIGFVIIKKNINFSYFSFKPHYLKSILKYSALSSFAVLGLNFLLSLDVLLIKHLFTSDIAGMYSSVTVLGKIIFWLTGPILLVAFPIFSDKHAQGVLPYRQLFYTFLAVLSVSLGAFLVMYLFPGFVISSLFGSKYSSASAFLPLYSFFIVLFSLNALFVRFFVAMENLLLSSLSFVSLLSEYFLVQFFFNKTIFEVLYTLISVQAVTLLVFLIYLYSLKRKKLFVFK